MSKTLEERVRALEEQVRELANSDIDLNSHWARALGLLRAFALCHILTSFPASPFRKLGDYSGKRPVGHETILP